MIRREKDVEMREEVRMYLVVGVYGVVLVEVGRAAAARTAHADCIPEVRSTKNLRNWLLGTSGNSSVAH